MPLLKVKYKDLIVVDTKRYCLYPYPGHPRGCTNFFGNCWGKNGSVQLQTVKEHLDPKYQIYFVYVETDLEAHAKRMKKLHPEWNYRQCRNLRHWQGNARRRAKEEIQKFKTVWNISHVEKYRKYFPDRCGIQMYETCRRSGLPLDPMDDLKLVRTLYLFGVPLPGDKLIVPERISDKKNYKEYL